MDKLSHLDRPERERLARQVVEAEADGGPSPGADWLARFKASRNIEMPGVRNDELLRLLVPWREPDDVRREVFPEVFGKTADAA